MFKSGNCAHLFNSMNNQVILDRDFEHTGNSYSVRSQWAVFDFPFVDDPNIGSDLSKLESDIVCKTYIYCTRVHFSITNHWLDGLSSSIIQCNIFLCIIIIIIIIIIRAYYYMCYY